MFELKFDWKMKIEGKKIPPPPRKVIIERLPTLPSKPQSIIIERWLPYKPIKRKVIYQRATDKVTPKTKNVIVQWETPNITVKKEFKDLGIVRANPIEYIERYGSTLKRSIELPSFVKDIKPPPGLVLAAESATSFNYELEGDLHALSLIDLESEGLNEYKSLLSKLSLDSSGKNLILPSRQSGYQNQNREFINELFNMVDMSANSSITLEEAEKLLVGLYSRLGKPYGQKEANLFFRQIKFNAHDSIDLKQFKTILEKEFLY